MSWKLEKELCSFRAVRESAMPPTVSAAPLDARSIRAVRFKPSGRLNAPEDTGRTKEVAERQMRAYMATRNTEILQD